MGSPTAGYAELFPGWDLDLHAYTLAPPIARRLGRATPILYPPPHSIPPLRLHLIGRLRCPTPIQRALALVLLLLLGPLILPWRSSCA